MRTLLHTTAITTLSATLAATSALAQDAAHETVGETVGETSAASTGDARAESTRDDLRYVLAGGYAHFFQTDFDAGGGEVSVDRGFGSLGVSGQTEAQLGWTFGLDWEGSWYGFDGSGTLSTAAGGTPWSAVQSITASVRLSKRSGERWNGTEALFVGAAGENDASVGDSLTFGGILGAGYAFSETFNLGAGVLLASRIEDDMLIIPQLLVDWRPCEAFRLSNFAGPEAFPGGAGLEAIWVLSEEYEVAFGGRYTYRRFRLDDSGSPTRADGIGVDQGLPIWLRATMRARSGLRVDLVGGFQLMGEMSLETSNGVRIAREDVEPTPFLGIFMSWKY